MIDRRFFLLSGSAALAGCMAPSRKGSGTQTGFERIKAGLGVGARLGVAALDTGSGRQLGFDEGSRYAMCSTFKAVLAGAVLHQIDASGRSLAEELPVGRGDLVPYAPVVTANLDRGRISLNALCAAIVEVSDNAAANILLRQIGGPTGFTAFVRRAGDSTTRLDRVEPELNSNFPDDPRDTTTPEAMVGLMRSLLIGDVLTPASRTRLAGWMENSKTGLTRLRAGLPQGWRAGDKTGTGSGANNDIAIAWPPGRAPLLVASYIDAREAADEAKNAAHAAIGRLVAERFA